MTRLEVLQEAAKEKCTCKRPGRWRKMASEVVQKNGYTDREFANRIHRALRVGGRKYVNVYIYGPRNCGKSAAAANTSPELNLTPACD